MELTGRQRGTQPVAATGADGGAAHESERHVGTQLRGERQELFTPELRAPEGVAGDQRGGGVRRASAHPAGDGNVLVDLQSDAAGVAGPPGQQACGLDRQI